jgi:hypothetical protein
VYPLHWASLDTKNTRVLAELPFKAIFAPAKDAIYIADVTNNRVHKVVK